MIATTAPATTALVAAAETADSAFHATFGEVLVTLSTLALVAVTVVLVMVSRELIRVTRQDAAMVAKANEIALREVGDVASDAMDLAGDAIEESGRTARAAINHRAAARKR